ncbi:MAG: MoaD/ThiS family protein [Oscillospiraceae bacterium]|jgi:molybdopterin converting factor small subunit|nr:MoaD/ThiS family protein [Oscillospiraceae bacterium]
MIVMFYGEVKKFTNGDNLIKVDALYDLNSLIDKLSELYSKDFHKIVTENEWLILINGEATTTTGAMNTRLKEHDKIEILPMAETG